MLQIKVCHFLYYLQRNLLALSACYYKCIVAFYTCTCKSILITFLFIRPQKFCGRIMILSSSVCRHMVFHAITFVPVDRFPWNFKHNDPHYNVVRYDVELPWTVNDAQTFCFDFCCSDWLIVVCLTSSGKYFVHLQDESTFNNTS